MTRIEWEIFVMSMRTWMCSNFQTLVGLICLKFKQYSKAEDAFYRSLSAVPTGAAFCGLGISFIQQSKYESAVESFQAAVALDPTNDHDLNWLNWATHLHSHATAEPGCRHCGRRTENQNGKNGHG